MTLTNDIPQNNIKLLSAKVIMQTQSIILSQDMERVNLFPIKHSDVNITSFRIVDPDSPRAREYLKDWTPEVFGRGRNHPLYVSKF